MTLAGGGNKSQSSAGIMPKMDRLVRDRGYERKPIVPLSASRINQTAATDCNNSGSKLRQLARLGTVKIDKTFFNDNV